MTLVEAKELERLKAQEAVNARLKLRDAKQKEIDATINRRSGGWHAARAELAFSFIPDDIEDKITIRKDMVSRCPELASSYEMKQFEEKLSTALDGSFQAVMNSLPVMGVRAPASTLTQVSTRKLSLRHRIHSAARMIQLESPKPARVARARIAENAKPVPTSYRFEIALSFPGESRLRVQTIAEKLTLSVPQESILYDKWLASELARPNLDIYLTDLYKKDSLLLVFFLSRHYAEKEWCGLEWRIGRDLLKQKQEHRLMPLRLDDAEIPGLHSIDGYLDIRDLSDAQVANAILERLAMLSDGQRFPPVPETIPEARVEDDIPDGSEYRNQRRLLGSTPVFDKMQQRPRWCIWVRPAEFKRARFRNLDQCANFMRAFASGRNRYPVFVEDGLQRADDWIACE